MSLQDLLDSQESCIEDMEKYFGTVGLNNIKKKELDLIIDKFGLVVFKMNCFSTVYNVVLENETSKIMHMLTYVIAIMTIIYTILTFIMVFK